MGAYSPELHGIKYRRTNTLTSEFYKFTVQWQEAVLEDSRERKDVIHQLGEMAKGLQDVVRGIDAGMTVLKEKLDTVIGQHGVQNQKLGTIWNEVLALEKRQADAIVQVERENAAIRNQLNTIASDTGRDNAMQALEEELVKWTGKLQCNGEPTTAKEIVERLKQSRPEREEKRQRVQEWAGTLMAPYTKEEIDPGECPACTSGQPDPCTCDKSVEKCDKCSPPVVCPTCKNEIDPDVCHCGDAKEAQCHVDEHNFVPMGCTCGYPTEKYDPTRECRGECAGCQIPREEMPCKDYNPPVDSATRRAVEQTEGREAERRSE